MTADATPSANWSQGGDPLLLVEARRTFDDSIGHRINEKGEADAWRSLFREALGEASRGSILDLACGTGEISRILLSLGGSVTGIDFAEPMLESARAQERGREGTLPGLCLRRRTPDGA